MASDVPERSPRAAPLRYEIDLAFEAGAESVDAWLETQIEWLRRLPEFRSVHVYTPVAATGAPLARTLSFELASERALDAWLEGPAAALDEALSERYGERARKSARLLRPERTSGEPAGAPCRNCGAELTGQYCWQCGQRARDRLITLWELFRDLIGDLFELDSRLWRSLIPLVFRPGLLTAEYLAGRRVRYMPPFRMYLVLSLVFFLLVQWDGNGIQLELGNVDLTVDETQEPGPADGNDAAPDAGRPDIEAPPAPAATPPAQADSVCDDLQFEIRLPWLDEQLTEEAAREKCRRIVANPRIFVESLFDHIPVSLLVLLPLLAAVMKVLYLFTGRYYVEHLLFFVHYHAFFFLVVTLAVLYARLASVVPPLDVATSLLTTVVTFYVPVYLYRAMRRVYGQGRGVTLFKFVALELAYLFCLTLVTVGALIVTALTV